MKAWDVKEIGYDHKTTTNKYSMYLCCYSGLFPVWVCEALFRWSLKRFFLNSNIKQWQTACSITVTAVRHLMCGYLIGYVNSSAVRHKKEVFFSFLTGNAINQHLFKHLVKILHIVSKIHRAYVCQQRKEILPYRAQTVQRVVGRTPATSSSVCQGWKSHMPERILYKYWIVLCIVYLFGVLKFEQ